MKKWRIILEIQIIINLLINITFLITNTHNKPITWIFSLILAYAAIVFFFKANQRFNTFNRWINILALPFAFTFCLNTIIDKLIQQNPANSDLISIIYLIIFLIYLLPVIVVSYGSVKNNYGRIIAVIILAVALLASLDMNFRTSTELLTHLFKVNIFTGLALIIAGLALFKCWGFQFKPNLKVKLSGWQVITWGILIAFSVWLAFFNTFSYFATSFEQLFFNWDFSYIIPTDYALLRSIGAALFEETERYLILILMLYAFKNRKHYLVLSIFLSAIQFGLLHFFNLTNNTTSLSFVTIQAGWTFAYGCFLATLYLYTAQIWLPLLAHFLFDFFAYSMSTSGGYGFLSLYGDPQIICGMMVAAFSLIATGLMLWGKHKQIMRENAERLVIKNKL